jgi:hypothetical protein
MEYEKVENSIYRKILIDKAQELKLINDTIAMHEQNIIELNKAKAELENVK